MQGPESPSQAAPHLRCVTAQLSVEGEKVKGSRFIAWAGPCPSQAALSKLIECAKSQDPGANHHCFAWRGSSEQAKRCSDDKEPYGSAGIPILKVIEGRALFETGVVVTRYFGGTKLGVGGLARAYSSAAALVLERAPNELRPVLQCFEIFFAYHHTSRMDALRVGYDAKLRGTDFASEVRWEICVPKLRADQFCQDVQDACRGQVKLQEIDPEDRPCES